MSDPKIYLMCTQCFRYPTSVPLVFFTLLDPLLTMRTKVIFNYSVLQHAFGVVFKSIGCIYWVVQIDTMCVRGRPSSGINSSSCNR